MEQKKTLWIIAAVGLFLAVIIGTACIIYTPSAQNAPTVSGISSFDKNQVANSGWTNPNANIAQNQAPNFSTDYSSDSVTIESRPIDVSDMTVYSDNTTVYSTPQYQDDATTIDLNVLKNELENLKNSDSKSDAKNQNINITVNVSDSSIATAPSMDISADKKIEPAKTVGDKPARKFDRSDKKDANVGKNEKDESNKKPEVAVKEEKNTPAVQAQSAAPKTSVKVEKKSEKKAENPVSTKTTKVQSEKQNVKASVTVKTETKKAPEVKKITQFWVQVGSYSSKKTAEVARSALDENKIPADIFTYKDSKDNLYFRVRVGPYTTKSEAEYWRSRIIKISDFAKAESYIVSTTN